LIHTSRFFIQWNRFRIDREFFAIRYDQISIGVIQFPPCINQFSIRMDRRAIFTSKKCRRRLPLQEKGGRDQRSRLQFGQQMLTDAGQQRLIIGGGGRFRSGGASGDGGTELLAIRHGGLIHWRIGYRFLGG
jgi:hypothetical protein